VWKNTSQATEAAAESSANAHATVAQHEQESFKAVPSCYIQRVLALVASVSVARIVRDDCAPHSLGAIVEQVPGWLHLLTSDTCGGRTIAEDDDAVNLVPFKTTAIVELWRNPQTLYGLDFQDGQKNIPIIFRNKGSRGRLLFNSAADAVIFRDWLLSQVRAGNYQGVYNSTLDWKNGETRVGLDGTPRLWSDRFVKLCVFGTPLYDQAAADSTDAAFLNRQEFCASYQ